MAAMFWLLVSVCFFFQFQVEASKPAKLHIVYLGHSDPELHPDAIAESHSSLLAETIGSEDASEALIYSYKHAFSGFAAKLTDEQVDRISGLPGVISVFPSGISKLHTTASWDFLGLSVDRRGRKHSLSRVGGSLWKNTDYGKDVIIGSLDTGVWPESESFSDEGMGPVPSRWRGICQAGQAFNSSLCNRKIIGARYYYKGMRAENISAAGDFFSARDKEGHGSHTASTAAGRFVPNVSLHGYGNGTAKGGAPFARLAIYKVCWPLGCSEVDILAAMDQAIEDGVDLMTLSLGGDPGEFFSDATAVGAFHAVQRGIPVVASGGNAGPTLGVVSNVAPWIVTVAASTLDRNFSSRAVLGNGAVYKGESISYKELKPWQYPLIASKDAFAPTSNSSRSELCVVGSLDPEKVRGKIVACLRGENSRVDKGHNVLLAGGAGMILCNGPAEGNEILADDHFVPTVHVTYTDGAAIFSYINASEHPTAYITPPVTMSGVKAPVMAAFSSPGPNVVVPDVLKPDITAPGVDIIAAISPASGDGSYGSMSGTSMSCPHVAGMIALLKAYHPEWSPAAIRSALSTTATVVDNKKNHILTNALERATPFHFGSGHVDPNAAAHPGLIYDVSESDYIAFLCDLYDSVAVALITGKRGIDCSTVAQPASALNLPSITLSNLTGVKTVTRFVTNVGDCVSTYWPKIEAPEGVSVSVEPSELAFTQAGQTLAFNVTFNATMPRKDYVFGSLTWKSYKHKVRIPLTVKAALA
ncbi:hypothetical protein SELMODRAFT_437460 [Selaginella moellendorffii]|uniref:Uncharacterized protein AIR3L7-1 n=1 Tax=Selaginella moellendorffii TaxID=88036 RepID=D8QR11_SELML|nr:hypothetical protein SELMODRAFT_437460 [Selaginella moellendorffii]